MADSRKFGTDHSAQSYDSTYEQDPRHIAVDAYAVSHLIPSPGTADDLSSRLDQIYHGSLAAGLPDISCSPLQAKFLMLQIRMANAKNVLEIGTLGGYSAAWMATAAPDLKVTTIELSAEYAAIATKHLQVAGLASQVEVIQGAALDVLPRLVAQVDASERRPFDFVFIDANKQDNAAYFEFALAMTRSRTAIVVDNVVRNGKVASAAEAEKDDRVLGTRKLIEAIGKSDKVDATIIQTVGEKNYDGFLIAIKR